VTSLGENIENYPTKQTLPRKKLSLEQFIIGPCKGKGRYGKVYLII
jgi:hypothetical protein